MKSGWPHPRDKGPPRTAARRRIATRPATFVPDPTVVTFEEIVAGDAGVTLFVRACREEECCPVCARRATRVHSWYTRRLTDLPWHGVAVGLCLRFLLAA